jgi:hypothetical protein
MLALLKTVRSRIEVIDLVDNDATNFQASEVWSNTITEEKIITNRFLVSCDSFLQVINSWIFLSDAAFLRGWGACGFDEHCARE